MGKAQTTWTPGITAPKFPKLPGNLKTEVAIVGGGMAGIMTAYYLAKTGKEVAVFESGKYLTEGATERTTAFLTHMIDTDVSELISMYGKKSAKLIWQSHKAAIDEIGRLVKKENIKCEFTRCSNFVFASSADQFADLMAEAEAMRDIGFKPKLGLKLLGFTNAGSLELPGQAKFHPLKFLQAIIKLASEAGVQFYENTKIESINNNKLKTAKHTIVAKHIVIATYDPLGNPKETFAKKGMYKSYVTELRVPHGKLKEAIYEDMQNPYHYLRVDRKPKFDRIIIGGEDNRFEIAVADRKNFAALRRFIQQLLGKTKYRVVRKWTGPILEPSDGLALIGQIRPHQYVATAFSGNGMTYSMIAAIIIRDAILQKRNPWQKLYDPKRPLKLGRLLQKGYDYAGEFFGGVAKNILK